NKSSLDPQDKSISGVQHDIHLCLKFRASKQRLQLAGNLFRNKTTSLTVGNNTSMDLDTQQSYPKLRPGEVSSGTTVMAVAYDGGVIMGADSRTSMGTYVSNRVADKITYLHDFIYCCRSGSAADTQAVSDYVRHFLSSHSMEVGRLPTVKTASNLVKTLVYQNKDQLLVGMIIAGWDPVEGGSVYEIPMGGTVIKQKFAVGGSGSTYIYGHLDAAFREGMTKEEAKQFVSKAISHAMARDGSSGGVIRMVCIDESGVR
ncbi:unnamed protein product, partial [Discosporangium mesarthrocarpum]